MCEFHFSATGAHALERILRVGYSVSPQHLSKFGEYFRLQTLRAFVGRQFKNELRQFLTVNHSAETAALGPDQRMSQIVVATASTTC